MFGIKRDFLANVTHLR